MKIALKYFGLLADITNKKEEFFLLEESTIAVSLLKSKVENTYQELKNTNYAIAVNQAMASLDYIVKDQDVVAFLPPFAGG
ncbi:MoaD/ThiS family protein [Flavobacterium restrictum]|uniref:MoaD/ThiS family protein n=1 Tax=Flavobacterium restrictum TaxID=2594428 RepID=A0A553E8W2_9FLAO|nr:MoaD/ThiS family protein [Flavobacterium restrictum]TRX41519.1 MoaD/ThiS family protein [Flavobacterium restrictum]